MTENRTTRSAARRRRAGAFVVLLVSLAAASGGAVAWRHWRAAARPPHRSPASPLISAAGTTMGGTWSVKLASPPASPSADQLQADIAALLDRLDGQMSTWRPASAVSRFNAYRGGDWFPVPRELAECVAAARRVSEQSGGAFDVTVAPLVDLWGFGATRPPGGAADRVPSDDAIAAARARVDFRRLECRADPPALRKADPELRIDLGGIGKGYAADAVGAYLDSVGASNYLVAVGGELRAKGNSPNGGPWRVGVEVPTPDVRRVLRALDLRDASLSTSGDYRNFFDAVDADGGRRRYSHEIDPRTGRPADGNLASVSVICPSGADADAWATALFVLGPDEGFELASRHDLAALFVTRGGGRFETHATAAFEQFTRDNGDPGATTKDTSLP